MAGISICGHVLGELEPAQAPPPLPKKSTTREGEERGEKISRELVLDQNTNDFFLPVKTCSISSGLALPIQRGTVDISGINPNWNMDKTPKLPNS